MRKYLLFTLVLISSFVLNSCNEDEIITKVNVINPPQWIQGKWGDGQSTVYFTFTKDNIILHTGSISTSINETVTNSTYSQTTSNSDFTFTLKPGLGYSQTYKFHKKDNNTMLYNIGFMEDSELEDWDMYFRH